MVGKVIIKHMGWERELVYCSSHPKVPKKGGSASLASLGDFFF